jgi:GPH family glycoside/pentoside/hexuronide:cation symporter
VNQTVSNRPPLTFATNVLYGVGSVAFGVHMTALTSLLLLFFNQVVGLPATWVGAAMMVTLVFDAICDPLIGEWSDHTRSRWGRRHPFMYASAVPIAIAFYFLFDPPMGWSQRSLFIYLVVMLVAARVLLSLYEIPSSALGPELTLDYDKRTSLMSSRFFFGTVGGAGMGVLAFEVFLHKDAANPLGVLYRAGYREFGLAAAVAIFFSIIISCVGTHRFIGSLVHTPRVRGTWREKFREVSGTLTNRSFLALTIAGMVGAVSTGLNQGLDLYLATYFFELTPTQLSYFAGLGIPAAFAGVALAMPVSKQFGKKPAMIGVFFASLLSGVAACVGLRLVGLLPPNGTTALIVILVLFRFASMTLGIVGLIIASSMMADVVEDAAVSTGQRSEGLLFAANGLIAKCVTGLGTFLSGLILAWVSFPQHAIQGQVDPTILRHLGMVFVPIVATFSAIAITVLSFYGIDRSTHQRNLERLERGSAPELPRPARLSSEDTYSGQANDARPRGMI